MAFWPFRNLSLRELATCLVRCALACALPARLDSRWLRRWRSTPALAGSLWRRWSCCSTLAEKSRDLKGTLRAQGAAPKALVAPLRLADAKAFGQARRRRRSCREHNAHARPWSLLLRPRLPRGLRLRLVQTLVAQMTPN